MLSKNDYCLKKGKTSSVMSENCFCFCHLNLIFSILSHNHSVFHVSIDFLVFQNKKTVFKKCKGIGTRARLTENRQIKCDNNPVEEAYEAPYLRRPFSLCKKPSLGLQSRADLLDVMGYQLTKKKTKKIFISPSFGP